MYLYVGDKKKYNTLSKYIYMRCVQTDYSVNHV